MKVIAASKDADMAAPAAIRCLYFPLRSRLLLVCGLTAAMLVLLLSYPVLQPATSSPDWVQQPPAARRPDILHYTALDPSEAEERNKIRQLLGGGGSHRVWHENRMDRLARMEEHWDPSDLYERSGSSKSKMVVFRHRSRDRWPADLSNPGFLPHIAEFKQLLQAWASKKRSEPQVMNQLVDLVKAPVDRYYGRLGAGSKSKYRSCAVVGNSGVLLKSTYGRAIDEHEMVIRLNNARVAGFEKWVGSKTTLLFVNSNIVHSCARRPRCSCQPHDTVAGSGAGAGGSRVPMISYICQVAHLMHVVYCSSFDKAPLLVTDPRFDSLCSKLVKYYSLLHFFEEGKGGYDEWNKVHDGSLFHYSSGMQAVMLALGICEAVDLYGFGKVANAKHHYHTNQKAELALHDYEAEYALYDDIVAGKWASIPFLNETGLRPPPLRIFR